MLGCLSWQVLHVGVSELHSTPKESTVEFPLVDTPPMWTLLLKVPERYSQNINLALGFKNSNKRGVSIFWRVYVFKPISGSAPRYTSTFNRWFFDKYVDNTLCKCFPCSLEWIQYLDYIYYWIYLSKGPLTAVIWLLLSSTHFWTWKPVSTIIFSWNDCSH